MKAPYSIILALIFLAVITQTQPLEARTWYITPDGTGDAPTIQAGVDSAAVEDTVEVACGTYFEYDISVKPDITLRSETGEPDCVTIDAQQFGNVLLCMDGGVVQIEGFTLTNGEAFSPVPESIFNCGGGLLCTRTEIQVANCIFKDNVSYGSGGGLFCGSPDFYLSVAILSNCLFIDNHALVGGGLGCGLMAHVNVLECVFTGNTAEYVGGGIDAAECVLTASNSTFSGNSGQYNGGGLSCYNCSPVFNNTIITFSPLGEAVFCNTGGSPTLSCCDLYGNMGGDWIGCIAGQANLNGNISVDPLFCDAESGDFTIRSDSPCAPENSPECGLIGAYGIGCEPPTGVDGSLANLATTNIGQAFPNPFNPQTTIEFSLAQESRVRLAVYDLLGRKVAVLIDDYRSAGPGSVTWDGRDTYGAAVASGVYIARLETAAGVQTRKLVVAR